MTHRKIRTQSSKDSAGKNWVIKRLSDDDCGYSYAVTLSGEPFAYVRRKSDAEFILMAYRAHGDERRYKTHLIDQMKRGAIDFLTKSVDGEVLLTAVQAAVDRHREILEFRGKREAIRRRVASLTLREQEVMRCVISGALNKQIAGHLGITEKTVKVHRGRVMEKMEVTSLADLVRECSVAGIDSEKVVN